MPHFIFWQPHSRAPGTRSYLRGVLVEESQAHPNCEDTKIEDVLLVRFHVKDRAVLLEAGLTAGVEKPTQLMNEWAAIWRARHGARLGCYRKPPAAACRAARWDRMRTFAGIRRGAVAAASAARAKLQQPTAARADPPTGFGDKKRSFFAAQPGRPDGGPYWNEKQASFRKLTLQKQGQVHQARGARLRGSDPFPKSKARPAGAAASTLIGVDRVAFLGYTATEQEADRGGTCEALAGAHRCRCADLLVLRDAQLLFATPACESDLCDLIYAACLGLPTVVGRAWRVAGGHPERVPAAKITWHRPLLKEKLRFHATEAFRKASPDVVEAIEHCCDRVPGCAWTLRSGPAPGVVTLESRAGVWEWLVAARKIVNTMGPRAATVNGRILG